MGHITQMINRIIEKNNDISNENTKKPTEIVNNTKDLQNYEHEQSTILIMNNKTNRFPKNLMFFQLDNVDAQESKTIEHGPEGAKRKNKEMQIEDPLSEAYSAKLNNLQQAAQNFPTTPLGFDSSEYLTSNYNYPGNQGSVDDMKKEVRESLA